MSVTVFSFEIFVFTTMRKLHISLQLYMYFISSCMYILCEVMLMIYDVIFCFGIFEVGHTF